MEKKLKSLSIIIVLILFVLFIAVEFFIIAPIFHFSFQGWFYWLWLILTIDLSWVLRFRSQNILYFSLTLMGVGGAFNVFGNFMVGEVILRLWVVVFLVGVVLFLIESGSSLPRNKNA